MITRAQRIGELTLRAILFVSLFSLAACVAHAPRSAVPPPKAPAPTPTPQVPKDLSAIPDVVPKIEPRSAKGNPPFYDVLGKRYFVMTSPTGYVERGVASWYGPGFHTAQTSNGEPYDMYGMTAAHKTLPLPCYVQVTNLKNGRSLVLRVNDRGPFKDGRIIDLSYTAAAKLDFLRDGTAFVEVRAITPEAPPGPAPAATTSLFVQAGAFSAEANASKLLTQLRAQGVDKAFVRQDDVNGKQMYRVRIGPIPNVVQFDRIVARLKSLGVTDARLALD
ncbi:MAG: septal ring lytic transglycosylase RlpA family protein [Povalibacter sp.]